MKNIPSWLYDLLIVVTGIVSMAFIIYGGSNGDAYSIIGVCLSAACASLWAFRPYPNVRVVKDA